MKKASNRTILKRIRKGIKCCPICGCRVMLSEDYGEGNVMAGECANCGIQVQKYEYDGKLTHIADLVNSERWQYLSLKSIRELAIFGEFGNVYHWDKIQNMIKSGKISYIGMNRIKWIREYSSIIKTKF